MGIFLNLQKHCCLNVKPHRPERTDFLIASLSREVSQLFNFAQFAYIFFSWLDRPSEPRAPHFLKIKDYSQTHHIS